MQQAQSIGFEIKSVSNLIMRSIDAKIAEIPGHDCTKMHGWIIGYVYDKGKNHDVFQKDIEREFKIRRSTATGMLQLMEKNGYMKRVSVEYDARLKKLVLTQKAIDLHKAIRTNIDEFEQGLMDCLTKEEQDVFFQITGKLKRMLEQK
ncbi:MarR family winged helix-turn-helix transcriptional regulator [Anaerosporobacter sp.]|uniref:MarR family winged helix-turn-helix transcriptional regulator n=1 Tax=Anaerosporobacter sp. TaxID=1872529 RepID=UPI00286F6B04|nr:MarR family transcriptional regulator [Anaerosporobacter sp.]